MQSTDEPQEAGSLREVPASEILAKIKKGKPVEYDRIIIHGDLNASNLDLNKRSINRGWVAEQNRVSEVAHIVTCPLAIINSQIDGSVSLKNIIFISSVNCKGTRFCGNVNFVGSEFEEEAIFEDSQFNKPAYFDFCKFGRPVAAKGDRSIRIGIAQRDGRFGDANFRGSLFREEVYFQQSIFGPADFSKSQFKGHASFMTSIFTGYADFKGSQFEKKAEFGKSHFEGFVFFMDSDFSNEVSFGGSQFDHIVNFSDSEFRWIASFAVSQFKGDVDFRRSRFYKDFSIARSQFSGDILTFRDAIFKDAKSQENACRRAKNALEKNGDRQEAGYHFYREMEGKRLQKPWYICYLEFVFIQLIFGYGVHPPRLIVWWIVIVTAFAAIYWIGSGISGATQLFDYLKFSLATAIAPGYIATIISPGSTGYRLAPEYQAVAIIESIFGTFLWAGFIATFAKKYMR